ncbi:hypothetical protein ACFL0Y_03665 [Patescibacteria group bacterium]
MKTSLSTGFSFGLTSGIITTLGLMVGLHSGTHSQAAVAGGILTIALADSFSDALGIHVSQESQKEVSKKQVWAATFSALVSKLLIGLSFMVPIFFLDLLPAVVISVIWGLLVLTIFSYLLGRKRNSNGWQMALEHLSIALVVIMATHFLGDWVAQLFGN